MHSLLRLKYEPELQMRFLDSTLSYGGASLKRPPLFSIGVSNAPTVSYFSKKATIEKKSVLIEDLLSLENCDEA